MSDFAQTQKDVGAWHEKTFTPDDIEWRLAEKLCEEAGEFKNAVGCYGKHETVAEEAADCMIVLMAWAHRNDVDLLAAVRRKFAIVQQRDQGAREERKYGTR